MYNIRDLIADLCIDVSMKYEGEETFFLVGSATPAGP